MPLGVAKPAMQEPAVRMRCAMGFLFWRGRVPVANFGICRGTFGSWTSSGQHLSLSGDGIDEIGMHDYDQRGA